VEEPSLRSLPVEVLAQVVAHLSPRDAWRLRATGRAFLAPMSDQTFWSAALDARSGPVARAEPPRRVSSQRRFELVACAEALLCYSHLSRVSLVAGVGDAEPTSATSRPAVTDRHSGSVAAVDASGILRCWSNWGSFADVGSSVAVHDTGRQVTAIAFDATGRRIAVGGADKAVVVHDVAGREIMRHNHQQSTRTCGGCQDETGDPKSKGKHWPCLTPGKMLRGHTGSVSCVAFVAGGSEQAKASSRTDSESSCRTSRVDVEEHIVASGGDDMTIRLHNTSSRRGLGVLRGHGSQVKSIAPTACGRQLLSCGSSDARVKLWDVESCMCVASVRCSDPISAIVVDSHRGDTVYVAYGRAAKVIDLRDSASTAAILSLPASWRSDSGPIRCMALRDDGMLAAGVGGGGVAIWDAAGPWEARGIGWPGRGGHRESKCVRVVALTPDAALIGCADGRVSTLALDGRYDEVLAPSAFSKQGVSALIVGRGRRCRYLGIGRDDGSLDVLDMLAEGKVVVDWEKAGRACDGLWGREALENCTPSPFWENTSWKTSVSAGAPVSRFRR
jgi:WD domain, G-beta repeat